VAVLRLFASAREAAGTGRAEIAASTVEGVLVEARSRFGERFAAVLDDCRIWVNGEPAESGDEVGERDEVAVLPPVSGGEAAR
jgi:molybdopterin synthase sulfur carrier subunit